MSDDVMNIFLDFQSLFEACADRLGSLIIAAVSVLVVCSVLYTSFLAWRKYKESTSKV